MVHEESSNGDITPTWIAVDADTVQTVREVWERVRSEGWRVDCELLSLIICVERTSSG